MGLDGVEIVLRVEELFGIEIGDEEAANVETVGEFYGLICSKLDLFPLKSPVTTEVLPVITQREKMFLLLERHKPLPAPARVLPWSPQSVWDCVVTIFVDQQQLRVEEIIPRARIAKDVGVD